MLPWIGCWLGAVTLSGSSGQSDVIGARAPASQVARTSRPVAFAHFSTSGQAHTRRAVRVAIEVRKCPTDPANWDTLAG